jgi:hypothetical protein
MQWTEIPREQMQIPGERYMPGTPYFRYENIFNEPLSRNAGKPVHELKEVVEIRFPANPQYKPVFGVDEMQTMDDNGRVVTWAERYKAQYQAFLAGAAQEAEGTPLEELMPYGMSQAQLSLCRALSIYSVEALHHLEGAGAKRNATITNDLKPIAARYMAARKDGTQAQTEINELKRQVAALTEQRGLGEEITVSTELQEKDPPLPEGYETMTDDDLKEAYAKLTGARPRGQPARATLINMLSELKAA